MSWLVVDTDNFGGDYPNERFVAGPYEDKSEAEQWAGKHNDGSGPYSPRYYKVVEDGYVLQPGFEP